MNTFNIIKKNWKNITIIFIIIFVLFIVLNKLIKENRQLQESVNMWTENYLTTVDSVIYYKDKAGDVVTRYKELEIEYKDFISKKYDQDKLISKIKNELKNSNFKNKQLQEALESILIVHGQGPMSVDTVYVDTMNKEYEHIYFCDDYLMFDGYKAFDTNHAYANYFYGDTILSLFVLEKTPYNREGEKRFFLWRLLFPRYKMEGITKTQNPNALIESATKLKIKDNRLERKLLYK